MVTKIFLAIIVLTIIITLNQPRKIEAKAQKFNMSYLYFGSPDNYIDKVEVTDGAVKVISPSYFDLNSDGSLKITEKLEEDFIKEMHDRNIKVIPFLSNHWDRELGRKALEDKEKLAKEIGQAIRDYDLDGVNIDLENLTGADRDEYLEFTKLVKKHLPEGKELSVAVAANPNGLKVGWHGSYDYEKLGEYADFIVIMAYDESYYGSEPGAIASYSFVEKSIRYALDNVPREKIILGIPLYGRYWRENDTVGGRGIHLTSVKDIIEEYDGIIEFDQEKMSPKATFTITEDKPFYVFGNELKSGKYEMWYEDKRSIKSKLQLAEKYDIRGTATWSLGQELPNTWEFFNQWIDDNYFDDINNHWAKKDILEVYKEGLMIGVNDREFRPSKSLTRAQAATAIVRILDLEKKNNIEQFSDVKRNYWAYDSIIIAKEHKIIEGIGDNNFIPDKPISREEMATILNRIIDIENQQDHINFTDISNDRWSYEAIENMTSNEIYKGYPDNTFKPEKEITRGQMATLLNRVKEYVDIKATP